MPSDLVKWEFDHYDRHNNIRLRTGREGEDEREAEGGRGREEGKGR